MNTLDYSLLIKDNNLHKKIERLQFVKTLLFWLTLPICALLFIGLLAVNSKAPLVTLGFSILMLAVLGSEFGFVIYFHRFLGKSRKGQELNPDDEIDKLFIGINGKYDSHYKFIKWLYLIIFIVAAGSFLFGLVFMVIGVILSFDLAFFLGILGFLFFIIVTIISSLVVSLISMFKKMSFINKAMSEIDKIKQYFNKLEGLTDKEIAKKKKSIFNNVYESQKLICYIYPDEEIRKKAQRLSFGYIIPLAIIGGIIGGFMPSMLNNGNPNVLFVLLGILIAFISATIAFGVIIQKNTLKKQHEIFDKDIERYKYHIEYAAETKRFQKASNIKTPIILIADILIGVLLWLFWVKETSQLFGLILFCLMLFLILLFAVFIPSYRAYRNRVKPLEVKIDEHLAQLGEASSADKANAIDAVDADSAEPLGNADIAPLFNINEVSNEKSIANEDKYMELKEIIKRFAESGWDLIDGAAKAWLYNDDFDSRLKLTEAVRLADKECGGCGCEFDALYKRALELLG